MADNSLGSTALAFPYFLLSCIGFRGVEEMMVTCSGRGGDGCGEGGSGGGNG